LPHHRIEAGATCALDAQFVACAGNFGEQMLELPSEKFESDCLARAAAKCGCSYRNSFSTPSSRMG